MIPQHTPDWLRDAGLELDDDEMQDAEDQMNCGLDSETGLCELAGSEFCELDCPYNIRDVA